MGTGAGYPPPAGRHVETSPVVSPWRLASAQGELEYVPPDDVPSEDLRCAACLRWPVEPVVLGCPGEHLLCRGCMRGALCPVDRQAFARFAAPQRRILGGLRGRAAGGRGCGLRVPQSARNSRAGGPSEVHAERTCRTWAPVPQALIVEGKPTLNPSSSRPSTRLRLEPPRSPPTDILLSSSQPTAPFSGRIFEPLPAGLAGVGRPPRSSASREMTPKSVAQADLGAPRPLAGALHFGLQLDGAAVGPRGRCQVCQPALQTERSRGHTHTHTPSHFGRRGGLAVAA